MSPFPRALPTPEHPDPRDAPALRWGVLGPGVIAADFTTALHRHTTQRVVAVGSRDAARAAAFAARHGVARAHGSYEELVADPGLDVVYVATPTSEHTAHALLAIAAGRHVLVEKPLARTAVEGVAIRAAAEARGVLALEAMKTLYLPHLQVLRRLLADGAIGEVRSAAAALGMPTPFDARTRLFDPALGGGVALDIGVYPVAFVHAVAGDIERVAARGTRAPSGVDDDIDAELTHAAGVRSRVTATWRRAVDGGAIVQGSRARVVLGAPFHNLAPLTLSDPAGSTIAFDERRWPGREGMAFEAAALARWVEIDDRAAVRTAGDASLAVLRVLDRIRDCVGAASADGTDFGNRLSKSSSPG
ncbi:putative dehydrogenase [Diaminobutyricimonas aerilata]|uniref:Putative dehydrogenase n=1 Tax=Diaminobutyricimonas aerilata TaxID=1162967 RepID=A0A2M9CFW5_9MICO|nr:Gfo/Idh/MocA family oxidoreductase [Diaminobutyricimonas aerilata]PJJ70750.1 putative dehydrogenase [Diaminobutyricimonas aerilata]